MAEEAGGNLKIVKYGDPVLRQRAAPVRHVTDDVRMLVEQMVAAMHEAHGVGLAANQVGVPLRVAVIEIDGELTALIDPEIVSAKGSESSDEGCLSLPRLFGQVARPTNVVVRARDLSGKRVKIAAEGLLARALCHEVDHLNGKLFVDTVEEPTLHWLVRTTDEGEPVVEPTGLEDALKAFAAARRAGG